MVDAYQLGLKVRSLHGEIDLIVSSNMTRTNHTSTVVNLHLKANKILYDNGLKDKTHGSLDGAPLEHALTIIEALQDNEVHPEHGGESNLAFKGRVTSSICKYLYLAEEIIILVTHSYVGNVAAEIFLKQEIQLKHGDFIELIPEHIPDLTIICGVIPEL